MALVMTELYLCYNGLTLKRKVGHELWLPKQKQLKQHRKQWQSFWVLKKSRLLNGVMR